MSETKKKEIKENKEKVSKNTNSKPSMEKRVENLEKKLDKLCDLLGQRI